MSYLALARKWRPHKFNQVVGQAHVLTALENALAQNRLHHAYLFSGTRGVGKTSIARLFAKGLNCESGITATPCGECATCREIDEGRFVDLMEIDAASRTKVEDTRDLLDNVQYKPARGRFKVYLIDEVHMLSRNSFNALLKTLEEPPEYVKFLLATTDPQKLPVTILSRCLQFHLKPITVDDIHQQLEHILSHEDVTFEQRALGMVSHAADGSMRDALSLTDQAIALGNGQVKTDLVSHMLGTLDTDQALHLLEAIAKFDPQTAMNCIEQLALNGVDWDNLLQELATQLHRIAMHQALPATLDKAQPDATKIELLSQVFSPQNVQLYYQIALKGRTDLTLAPNARTGLEMVVLRMLAFSPVESQGLNPITVNSAAQPQVPTQQAQAAVQQTSVQQAPATQPLMQHGSAQQVSAPQNNGQVPSSPISSGQAPVMPSSQVAPLNTPPQAPMTPSNQRSSFSNQAAPMSRSFESENPNPNERHNASGVNTQDQYSASANNTAPSPSPAEFAKPASPIAGLRHQLRSQRKNGTANNGDTSAKKASATSKPQSVIERVAQQQSRSNPVSQTSALMNKAKSSTTDTKNDDAYRWQPTRPAEVKQQKSKELTPSELKKALEHTKTPEMAEKLVVESIAQDSWTAMISRLNTAKLVEQLALNSVYKLTGTSIELTLRPHQQHLNTDKAQQELLSALNQELNIDAHLSVSIGEEGETPLELRERLYQVRLNKAFVSLDDDPNVQFLARRFDAQLDRDSVRPI